MDGVNLWLDSNGEATGRMKKHLVATVNDHAFMASSTGNLLDAALLDLRSPGAESGDARRHVFASVEQIVLYAGRISALIQPLPPMRKVTADEKRLREVRASFMAEIFGGEDLPALHDRLVRNRIEHYDERVEEAIANAGPGAAWVQDTLGPASLIVFSGGPPPIWQRRFDPKSGDFEILGETTNIRALVAQIHAVYRISNAWLQAHGGR